MANKVFNHICVALDGKIKSPIPANPRLPKIVRLAILLGMERRIAQVKNKQPDLFVKSPLDSRRGGKIAAYRLSA